MNLESKQSCGNCSGWLVLIAQYCIVALFAVTQRVSSLYDQYHLMHHCADISISQWMILYQRNAITYFY